MEHLRTALAAELRQDPSRLQVDWVQPDPLPLFRLLRSHVLRELGFPLHHSDIPHCVSVRRFAEHLARELQVPPAPIAPMEELEARAAPAWAPMERRYDQPLERPLVFLLSAPRSGSTLLSAMLGNHPKVYAALELFLLPFDSMGARAQLLGSEGAWLRVGLFSAIRDLTGMTEAQADQECMLLEQQDIPVASVYRRLQELAGTRMLLDKSPGYAFYAAWLARAERLFRAPRYIHLTRHPGAVIESFVRMRFHRLFDRDGPVWDDNAWLLAEKVWTNSNRNIADFLRAVEPNRHLRVSFEALVTDPAGVLDAICGFLGLPSDPASLEPYAWRDRSSAGMGGPRMGDPGFLEHSGIDAALASDWRRAPPPQRLGRITREVAEALGYAVE